MKEQFHEQEHKREQEVTKPIVEKHPLRKSLRSIIQPVAFAVTIALISSPFIGAGLVAHAELQRPADYELEALGLKIVIGGLAVIGVLAAGMYLWDRMAITLRDIQRDIQRNVHPHN